jgi:phenylpyruvate tautomerase PptA (4-oxalocrotonate tautomerase family)
MAVINISLFKGKIIEDKIRICEAIQKALKAAFKIDHNNFHFRINEYAESEMIIPAGSSRNYLIIEIDLMQGKSISEKTIFYKDIRDELHELDINENDILVLLREPISENWCIRGEIGQEIKKPNNETINLNKTA